MHFWTPCRNVHCFGIHLKEDAGLKCIRHHRHNNQARFTRYLSPVVITYIIILIIVTVKTTSSYYYCYRSYIRHHFRHCRRRHHHRHKHHRRYHCLTLSVEKSFYRLIVAFLITNKTVCPCSAISCYRAVNVATVATKLSATAASKGLRTYLKGRKAGGQDEEAVKEEDVSVAMQSITDV